MPSQEDYLDSLLKNLGKDPMDEDGTEETGGSADEPADDDALLENAWSGLESALDSDGNLNMELLGLDPEQDDLVSSDEGTLPDDDDLLSMLDGVDDDDLRDIHEMLDRADNKEAVDESILRQNSGDEKDADEPEEQKPLSKREQRAQQRKLRKQEKAAAKAEKKAAKEAAKAAKKGNAVKGSPTESEPDASAGAVKRKPVPSDPLFDTSLLDSIVADASQAGNEGKSLGSGKESSAQQDENDPDILGLDLDSLYGDNKNDASNGDSSSLPDFVALDAEELDNLIPEHEKPEQKKKGFFAKIFDFLTEEDEDEENESLKLSDENRDILNDLDKEKADAKKKKKKKDDGGKAKAKGNKAKKPPKPKKEKPKKEKPKKEKIPDPEPLIPERKLTLKAVLPVVLACVSFGVLIIVFVIASVDFTYRQTASDAYDAGDYETCFQFFYGKDLNETEEAMFEKSRSILYIRLWLREYEMFADEGAEVEALDSLLQTVKDYPKLYDHAVQWNADAEVAAGYQTILNILLEKYGLTEEQAKEIAAVRNDRAYTRLVVEIVYGNTYGSWNEPATTPEPEPEPEQTPLQDVLPEEEGLLDGGFIDN